MQRRRPMTLSLFRPTALLAALLGLLAFAPLARALDPQVRDDAHFFSANAVEQANSIIKQIKQDHSKDFMVETYPAIPPDLQSSYSPDRKDQFFSDWAVKRAEDQGVNGVFVLICRNPSHLYVQAGRETRKQAF